MVKETLIAYLTGNFAYSAELQAFWMAFQGSMAVRGGVNRDGKMHWFHAFMVSVLTGYAGATFAFLWIGKPTSILSNDMNLAMCIITFILVNYTPFDMGYKLGKTAPVLIITTMFAQLFRVGGIIKFNQIGFEAFRDKPSEYYPIPVFGPIILATLLGNMGGFFHKGFHGYLKNGIPWPFQNGFFCATFYHFYVNDKTGFVGVTLRKIIGDLPSKLLGLDDAIFPVVTVSVFMHAVSLLQLPLLFGPSFSPFNKGPDVISRISRGFSVEEPAVKEIRNEKKAKKKVGKSMQDSKKKN